MTHRRLAAGLFSRHNGPAQGNTMRNWRARLTPLQRRIYDRSAAIPTVPLTPSSQLLEASARLEAELASADRAQVEALSQTIVNHICWQLNIRTVRVQV